MKDLMSFYTVISKVPSFFFSNKPSQMLLRKINYLRTEKASKFLSLILVHLKFQIRKKI